MIFFAITLKKSSRRVRRLPTTPAITPRGVNVRQSILMVAVFATEGADDIRQLHRRVSGNVGRGLGVKLHAEG